jgi:polysaccharide pyruvyl transferase WcaK-like protein
MKVAIVNAYDRHNAGDAALLSALISQVRLAFPDADISYAGLESRLEHSEFEGVRNLGSIRRWVGDDTVARGRRIRRKALAVGLLLLPAVALRILARKSSTEGGSEPVDEVRALVRADLVVGLGGGYMNGTPSWAGTLNVLFLLLPLILANRLRRPTVLAPQSYGPFGGRVQVTMVRFCLNRVGHVYVREDSSLDLLRASGVRVSVLSRGIDSAFALDDRPPSHPAAPDRAARPRVGITARAWLPERKQESYERSLAAFVDWLQQSRGAMVTLVPQVTSKYQGDDDRIVTRRVASYCATAPAVIEDQLDHVALRNLYGDFDFVVGTRFHSVIFSLTSGTPALAIEYEHKTSGIMGDLGLGQWVMPIEAVTADRLCRRFEALEAAGADYHRLLKEELPAYIGRARRFVRALEQSVP